LAFRPKSGRTEGRQRLRQFQDKPDAGGTAFRAWTGAYGEGAGARGTGGNGESGGGEGAGDVYMINSHKLKAKLNDAETVIKDNIGNMRVIAKDAERVSTIARDVHIVITDIDKQFESATKLNKIDIAFLFLAVALQVVRQYFLTNFKERLDDKTAAKQTKGHTEEHSDRSHRWYHPSLNEVITNPVPFDTTYGSPDFDLNMGGGFNHRSSTLGHDPILGWIFGTMNIATSTVTLWTFNSYHVKTGFDVLNRAKDKITNHANTGKIAQVSIERLLNEGIEGKTIIGSSLIKEAIHLKSDINTKASLPIPVISIISPELARKLADFGLDMANVTTITSQAVLAALINTIIAMIHGLFKNDNESWNLYEVKTRKILSYSNLIASISNIIAVAIGSIIGVTSSNPKMVQKSLSYLDIGGCIVTIYRIITDYNFIKQIKQEFLEKEFYNIVMGEEYNF
jgi:soluble cytochrome b562